MQDGTSRGQERTLVKVSNLAPPLRALKALDK